MNRLENLKHIEINIGKACNNKCLFCMSSKPNLWDIKFVSLEDVKSKIKSYSDKGYKSIGFLGGDISIHPDIIEIIKYCKSLGYININIISNGMKFDDEELSKEIVMSGTTRINFSIHSHLDEVEDKLIQVPGGLKRKLKAIDNFQLLHKGGYLRDALSINIVVNKQNYKTIVETVLFFFVKKNIKDIRINFIRLTKDVKENWDDLKLSYTEFLPYLKKLIYFSLKYKFRLTFDTIPACIFYKIDRAKYKYLVRKFMGEDLDHITEIDHINAKSNFNWQERKKDQLKTQFEQCKKCIYEKSCQGVRKEYGELYGGKEFFPITKIDRKNSLSEDKGNNFENSNSKDNGNKEKSKEKNKDNDNGKSENNKAKKDNKEVSYEEYKDSLNGYFKTADKDIFLKLLYIDNLIDKIEKE